MNAFCHLCIDTGKDVTREVDVDLISRAIRGIQASNVPFIGAISTLSLHISGVRNNRLYWALGTGAVGAAIIAAPVAILATAPVVVGEVVLCTSGVFATSAWLNHQELNQVKDCMGLFSQIQNVPKY